MCVSGWKSRQWGGIAKISIDTHTPTHMYTGISIQWFTAFFEQHIGKEIKIIYMQIVVT